ncbi:hypothetical protein [Trichormus variabilis]|uniref:Uncharacterized protein n=1 Tax=Trichormus variabilis SAG 1403-4b TaxID=447716 RepID=A0A3S1BXE4_ANAVA|nr:hypothetical protein [Trichormus variabilis]MBD2629577.1 hypothetical protein [Trichormus variabilis FACHB-164]RUS93003.1 hypothetical protein DSM107003_47500 [Trichormus variabilis SAG 1403-4b]
MTEDFEQLIPILVRPEEQPEKKEQKIFYPKWRCFCCQDSGKVTINLVRLIMPDYDEDRDLWVACQNPSCHSFREKWSGIAAQNFDTRFLPKICQKLDLKSREDWRNTVQRQVDIRTLARTMAMSGVSERTETNNYEVQQRKKAIEAIPHQKWMAMSSAYFEGKENDED